MNPVEMGGTGPAGVPDQLRGMKDHPGAEAWERLISRMLEAHKVLDDELNAADLYVVQINQSSNASEVLQFREGKSGRWHHLATWHRYWNDGSGDWCYDYTEDLAPYHDTEENPRIDDWRDIWG